MANSHLNVANFEDKFWLIWLLLNAFSIYGCDKLLKNSIRKIRFSLYTPFLCILLAHGFLKFVKTFYHQDLLNAVQ